MNGIRREGVKQGFTLIELLVVIAIISILASILFPVFARVREQARKTNCQTNMKQIALAVKQYISDYDERHPLIAVTTNSGPTPPYGWADALQPYLRSTQIYQCPSELNTPVNTPNAAGYNDYWINGMMNVRPNPSGPVLGLNEAALNASALTILLGEGGNHDARYNQCGTGGGVDSSNPICDLSGAPSVTTPALVSVADGATMQQHLEGSNFAFTDGHVKWLKGNSSSQCSQVTGPGDGSGGIGKAGNSGGKFTFAP
ncbi:MAG: DUF1559 domain-containing protein [Armatimonadota bacterium]|nr:DUF1559 domain-containing protein [Armatimonadota bacterium]